MFKKKLKTAPAIAVIVPMIALSLTTSVSLAQTSEPRPANWAEPVAAAQNLFRVTPGFYRSAQLQSTDVARLQSLGIKTVISLRSFHSDEDLFKNSGIKLQRIGINTWDINDANVVRALRAVKAAEKEGPLLLHCMHGADRTGLVTAMYRILYQGWTKEQALEELTKGGYGYHSMWKNIPEYLQKVDIEKIRKGVEQS
ncbi:dual specificity protein phosphatase family protein [Undibacterium sp. TJN19]|uniref:dual specificity protein phosphatase family protein n=1 Tax=Undibacterium sp. TJN19 TaxID=3413055 RepID=UPI003BF3E238